MKKILIGICAVTVALVALADPNGLTPDGWGDTKTNDTSTCGHNNQSGTCYIKKERYQKCKTGNPWDTCTAGYVENGSQSGQCRPIDLKTGLTLNANVSPAVCVAGNASCATGGYDCAWN